MWHLNFLQPPVQSKAHYVHVLQVQRTKGKKEEKGGSTTKSPVYLFKLSDSEVLTSCHRKQSHWAFTAGWCDKESSGQCCMKENVMWGTPGPEVRGSVCACMYVCVCAGVHTPTQVQTQQARPISQVVHLGKYPTPLELSKSLMGSAQTLPQGPHSASMLPALWLFAGLCFPSFYI